MSAHSLERIQHLFAPISAHFPPPWSADLHFALKLLFGVLSIPRFRGSSHGDLCGLCWADDQKTMLRKTWARVTEAGSGAGGDVSSRDFSPLPCTPEGGQAPLAEYSVHPGVRAWLGVRAKSFSTEAAVPEPAVSILLL